MQRNRKPKSLIALGICLVILVALQAVRFNRNRIVVPDEVKAMGRVLGAQIAADLPGGGQMGVIPSPAIDETAEADQQAFLSGVEEAAGRAFTVKSSIEQLETTGVDAAFELRGRNAATWLRRLKDAFAEMGDCDAAIIEIHRERMPRPKDLAEFPPLYVIDHAGAQSWKTYFDAGVVHAVISPAFDDEPTPPNARREEGCFLTTPAKK